MPKVLDNIITAAAAPDPANHIVALTWANGERTINNFRPPVGNGVFAAFADPAFFAQPRVGKGGRSPQPRTARRTRFLRRRAVVRGAPSGCAQAAPAQS
jgi:hypothetical protein